SRAEFRTLLRQDNADIRLTPLGYEIGLADEERFMAVNAKTTDYQLVMKKLADTSIEPQEVNPWFETLETDPIRQKIKMVSVLGRPQVDLKSMIDQLPSVRSLVDQLNVSTEALEQAEINIKYAGYIDRELELANKMNRLEHLRLPSDLDYLAIPSLSMEARQKLSQLQPETLGQASRISGVNPADISVLMVYIGR
ncbi:MAG: tRNA uridine-5-carboxymethylaminomethyl(34) synthesis enzyme MnmG, partial [Bacteroidota bacterium]